jgi:hypothetical protein
MGDGIRGTRTVRSFVSTDERESLYTNNRCPSFFRSNCQYTNAIACSIEWESMERDDAKPNQGKWIHYSVYTHTHTDTHRHTPTHTFTPRTKASKCVGIGVQCGCCKGRDGSAGGAGHHTPTHTMRRCCSVAIETSVVPPPDGGLSRLAAYAVLTDRQRQTDVLVVSTNRQKDRRTEGDTENHSRLILQTKTRFGRIQLPVDNLSHFTAQCFPTRSSTVRNQSTMREWLTVTTHTIIHKQTDPFHYASTSDKQTTAQHLQLHHPDTF